uniref:CCDC113/CCDC96 coiled-coil domain-containing protein n=1 Tax=Knipowitschia caucasica TaxID=637954 RepID=A0AAV2KTK2_KNICA
MPWGSTFTADGAALCIPSVDQEWREVLSLKKDVALTVLSRHMVRAEAQLRVDSALAWEQQQQEVLTRLRLQNLRLDSRIHRLQQELQEADRNATNPFQRQYERLQTRTSERKRRRQRRQQEARGAQARLLQRLQMQSHTKQRLQNTEAQIQHQREKLAEVDAILAQRRDALTRVKRAVSSLQKDRGRLREQCGLMGNVVLLKDYHSTQQAMAALEGKLQELKCRQADLEFDFEQRKKRFQTI